MSPHADRPLVSCIVTTFNYAHFVTEAVDSALAQTYGENALEIIVVDGASTDDTPHVLEPYLDRITYIREPSNEGVVSSANRGLEVAGGELIAFLNADDAWYPSTVERLAGRFAAKPDSGLVYGDMEMIDAEGRSLHPSYYEQFGIRPASGRLLGRLLRRNFIASGCYMFRAELLPACQPIPDWAPWEDWYMMVRLAEVADFDYLPAPVLRYRFHGTNQVLMAEGDRLVATWRKELPFRRRLLREIAPRVVSVGELIAAVGEFDAAARRLGEAVPDELAAALPVVEEDRIEASGAAAAAALSEQDSDHDAALFHAAHALAHDPGDERLRRAFARCATRLLDHEAEAVDERRAALSALSRPGPQRKVGERAGEPVEEALRAIRDLTARLWEVAPEPELPPFGPAGEVGRATPADRHEALFAELGDDVAGLRMLHVRSWADLDSGEPGGFDLIHADGLVEEELGLLSALERLRDLLADRGRIYLGFTRAASPERSEYVRFVNGAADGRVLLLPGRTALDWMVEAAGLTTVRELAVAPTEWSGIPVERGYLELTA